MQAQMLGHFVFRVYPFHFLFVFSLYLCITIKSIMMKKNLITILCLLFSMGASSQVLRTWNWTPNAGESAEFEKSKATHIFKCSENSFIEKVEEIKNYIENDRYVRSFLHSVEYNDLKTKEKLQYIGDVKHDSVDYQIWEDRMKGQMKFLK